jgi:F0F1-type ATP synthase membrane subunit c/vacuolar-type H+-ATPase subunit K
MKSFAEKLFTSPSGSGFFESPAFFFGLGAALLVFAAHGAATGQFVTGRSFVIAYAEKPGFFMFMLVTILALGTIALYRGYRRWRAHDE